MLFLLARLLRSFFWQRAVQRLFAWLLQQHPPRHEPRKLFRMPAWDLQPVSPLLVHPRARTPLNQTQLTLLPPHTCKPAHPITTAWRGRLLPPAFPAPRAPRAPRLARAARTLVCLAPAGPGRQGAPLFARLLPLAPLRVPRPPPFPCARLALTTPNRAQMRPLLAPPAPPAPPPPPRAPRFPPSALCFPFPAPLAHSRAQTAPPAFPLTAPRCCAPPPVCCRGPASSPRKGLRGLSRWHQRLPCCRLLALPNWQAVPGPHVAPSLQLFRQRRAVGCSGKGWAPHRRGRGTLGCMPATAAAATPCACHRLHPAANNVA